MKNYGLVLAGGGGKGSFQVGVLKALKEEGILDTVTAVSGASIGAINGCLVCEGKLESATKIWKSIDPRMFLEPDFANGVMITQMSISSAESLMKEIMKKYEIVLMNKTYEMFAQNHIGAFKRDGLVKLMRENINYENISKSAVSLYVDMCDCSDDRLAIEYMKLNGKSGDDIEKLVLASSALPFVYDAVEYEGKIYRDGGILDNVPIKPLYDAGYKDIIVVGLKPDYGIDYSQYKDCNFTFIMPPKSIGGFVDGTMDFTAQGAKFRIAYGYRTAKRIVEAYKSGRVNEPDYNTWLAAMSQLDYDAAQQDVRQEKVFEVSNEHMDKLKDIYSKYM